MKQLPRDKNVAYIGPIGTFSYFTAHYSLPEAILRPYTTFKAVFEAVQSEECPIAFIPIENSLNGTVGQNFDLFLQHQDIRIQGEVTKRISHSFLSKEEHPQNVDIIYTHPQPIGQCADWLNEHYPNAEIVSTTSTAMAAELASENPRSAGIGHPDLAKIYNLNPLFTEIEDDKNNNWTRFLVITSPNSPIYVKKEDNDTRVWKSSFIFTMKNEPGSLVSILSILEKYKINMRKLESRPLRGNTGNDNWSYAFFTDVECDLYDGTHEALLKELEKKCASLRILGSYPHGGIIR